MVNMFKLVFISVFVQLYFISLSNGESATYQNVTGDYQNVTIHESSQINLRLYNLQKRSLDDNCKARCSVNSTQINMLCGVNIIDKIAQYIFVATNDSLSEKSSGQWNCNYEVTATNPHCHASTCKPQPPTTLQFSFTLVVNVYVDKDSGSVFPYLWWSLGTLGIMIMCGQTICIIYFKRKAKAIRRHANLSKKSGTTEDVVRYSTMPSPKNKTEQLTGARESGIYEVLENVRGPPVPRPPSLTTLPRTRTCHKSPRPVKSRDEVEASLSQKSTGSLPSSSKDSLTRSLARTFTNGVPMPIGGSLARNKRNEPLKQSVPDYPNSSRSSLDRMKERSPLPVPIEDEVYEVMDEHTRPHWEEPSKTELLRDFGNRSRAVPAPVPSSYAHGAHHLQPQMLPAELKLALEQRQRTNPPASHSPKVIPFNPGLPPPHTAPTVLSPHTPRQARPPAPNRDLPKWRPPPPSKPKQQALLPPPQTGLATPTSQHRQLPPFPQHSLQVHHQKMDICSDDDGSDDEWNMENLYSI